MIGIRFERLFRASVYLMLVFASIALSIDSNGDNPIAMAYPLVTIFISIIAFLKVDRGDVAGLARRLGSLLAILSIPLVIAEVRIGWRMLESDLLVLALGHWLLYLCWIKMMMPKSVEDDWFLFLLGLVMVLTAAVISQSDVVGQLIFVWAIISLGSLTLFHLEREAARSNHPELGANLPASARIKTRDQPYPRIFDRPFLISGIRVVATTLVMSVLVFLIMPRGDIMRASRNSGSASRHLTGFDEEVKLGQLGEILENNAVVLTVEFFDFEGHKTMPQEETYWRGVTMARYDNGQWRRQDSSLGSLPVRPDLKNTIRQKIRQEPSDSTVVFGLRPVLKADSLMRLRSGIMFNNTDGTMFRRSYSNTYEYQIYSSKKSTDTQPGEILPDLRQRNQLLAMTPNLRAELQSLTGPIVSAISKTDTEARARALENHFFNPSLYAYTLEQTRIDNQIDPVLDFLKNRKEGHCEYFASALALMLRAEGIPSRLVNGFKGGDWNSLGQVMYVREKYAHAWVEALVSSGPDQIPRWITLDPTPANQRAESVAQVGMFNYFRQATDFVRYIWVFYIIGFDSERQYRLIYEPVIALFQEAKTGLFIIVEGIRELLNGTRRLSDLVRFFSARGFIGGLMLAVSAIVILQIARRIFRQFLYRMAKKRRAQTLVTPGIAIYQRLEALLGELDLRRSKNETPREFADRVGRILYERFVETGLEGIPDLVVDAFYKIRFGGLAIDAQQLALMDDQLNTLELQIRKRPGS